MKILIVDDQQIKAEKLATYIRDNFNDVEIIYANNAQDGFRALEHTEINLVLLDVVLPLNFGSEASEEGSLWFIREVKRKILDRQLPFIVGTTQYAESLQKVQDTFRSDLWSVVYVGAADDRWPQQIRQAVRFARSNAERLVLNKAGEGHHYDVALVAALRTPEFSELINALGGGEQIRVEETDEIWMRSKITRRDGVEISVLAACAEEMGMTAMASLVTKIGMTCNPKKIFLSGIMAGNPERVGFSDLVIVEGTWNFQAGKLSEKGFSPDMKSLPCSYKLANLAKNSLSEKFVLDFWQAWKGNKPQQIAKVHSGEVACSPYVVADGKTFKKLEEQKRKIVGLEMEAFGCYEAARRLGDLAPDVLCLKSVCDFGNAAKDDGYQTYCAALSSAAIVQLLNDAKLLE